VDERYPDPTAEELERTDRVCIICREDMIVPEAGRDDVLPVRDKPKKLTCGHIFHLGCLRGWLERQQTCPTWYV
jgi:E3 ubiquitin-protein ligase synoviolin